MEMKCLSKVNMQSLLIGCHFLDLSNVKLQVKHKPFGAMVIVATHSCQDDEVLYDCLKDYMIWESILLCVWFLSTLAWFLSTICCKVCEFVLKES